MQESRLKKHFGCWLAVLLLTMSQNTVALTWNDGVGGATRDYYSSAAKLPWDKKRGDWRDIEGKLWGEKAFVEKLIKRRSDNKIIFDVKRLILGFQTEKYKNNGFLLRVLSGSVVKLFSKENREQQKQPYLIIETNKNQYVLPAISDTFLDSTTSKSLGKSSSLTVSRTQPTLIIFDLKQLKKNEKVIKAELQVTVKKMYGNSSKVGIYRIDPAPNSSPAAPISDGIAKKYPLDKNISVDKNVYFATSFENTNWQDGWKGGGQMGQVITSDDANKFSQFLGRAISSTIPKGKTTGLNYHLKFKDLGVPEPEEAYFRYYIRLADNWDQTVTGGKLPGFAGTYNRAGWGSRKPNGENGWSARGRFLKTIHSNNKRINPIGSYVYHVDQYGYYGSAWTWSKGEGGLLENNRWYCIEQFVKLNEPNKKNGELRAWVDGRLVFKQKGLRFRLSNKLKIEEVWFNVYHGGTASSPRDQTVYIDNLVVSKKYIGPVKKP